MPQHHLQFGEPAQAFGGPQIECAVDVYGARNVLFGGSYPVRREWRINGVDFLNNLALDESERALVLGGNAARLFGLQV